MEGYITFHVIPTPSYDTFQTVTLSVGIQQCGGFGALNIHKEMAVEEARVFAREIEAACAIVAEDQQR